MLSKKSLKKVASKKVKIFKIKNRKGYAAIYLSNLTEGKSPSEAYGRLSNPLKRMGLELSGKAPSPKTFA